MMFARAASSILLLAGAYPRLTAQDAREIIGRGVALYERNSQLSRNYTFLERQEVRELDRSGHLKGRKIETWDITLLDGSPYRRLVARNDQPLAAEEQRAEEEKLRVSNEERRKETADERAQRLARWQRRIDRQREPVRELLDAFDFTLAGEQQMGGRGVYRIDASPRPGYQPKSQFASFFPKVKLRFWVDKQDYQAARIEMETLDTISFGGFLVRVGKGTHLVIEQTRVNNEVWLPREVLLTAAARILLVKGFNRELAFTFSDYKKFQVDSHVVAVAEP